MKKFFLLLFLLPALSWAGNLGMSTEGKKANPSLASAVKLDSAKFVFYYPYGNGYVTAYGYPDDNDSLNVVDTTVAGIDLDSIGSHHLKVTYYPHDGGSAIVYGQWLHESDIDGQLEEIAVYQGSKDGWYKVLWPPDGSANKDSSQIYDDGDVLKATLIFHHSNTDVVIDTVTYEKY